MDLSIVVPVYKEEKNVPEYLVRTQAILKSVTDDYEIIFALDPSPDHTEDVVLKERQRDHRIKLLKFSRRFGQPMCTLGGMTYASGHSVIIMDVDLQDPPQLIPEMYSKWKEGYDVVIPQRRTRTGEPWIKRFVSEVGYNIIKKIQINC